MHPETLRSALDLFWLSRRRTAKLRFAVKRWACRSFCRQAWPLTSRSGRAAPAGCSSCADYGCGLLIGTSYVGSITARRCPTHPCPTPTPSSRSAWRSQPRSVSGLQPTFPAIEVSAADREAYSPSCSRTIRTARSRSSAGYGFLVVFAPIGSILPNLGASGKLGGGSVSK